MEKRLNISEIFFSIQGESTHAGIPCIFIRLSGCNLSCAYCDTRYAEEIKERLTISEIHERIEKYPGKLIEITGGEPLFQKMTPELVRTLLLKGYTVLVETNGSMNIDQVDRRCIRIMDIKCPDSMESGSMDFENFKRLTPSDQVKFVISSRKDFDYAREIIQKHSPPIPYGNILFSPVKEKIKPNILAQWIIDEKLTVRLQLQLHKILWPEKEMGV